MSTGAERPHQDRLFELPVAPGGTPKLFSFDQLLELASDPVPELSVGGSGLFPPELTLGPGNLARDDEAAICAHLVAVARARQIPLHPAIAWNALYFGYEPESGGYDMTMMRDSDLVQLVSHSRADALPVGALVTFHSEEGAPHDEWAEIVYKEGRPPAALDGSYVVARYSGAVDVVSASPRMQGAETDHADAPQGEQAADEASAVTELLVLDFDPFAQLGAQARSWLEHTRARRDRHALDAAGHVLVDAIYPEGAGLSSDLEYFSDWMMSSHRESLAEGWLGAALDDPSDGEALAEAMWNSLLAIESVLERSDAFDDLAGYWYLREDLDAFAADANQPGGTGDAGHLLASMASVPRGDRVAYHPIAPPLEVLLGPELLRYEHYARHIVYANVLVGRALTERCDEGVLTKAGENFGVRLDDGWLYGGTWRAELLSADSICPLIGFDPMITIGLGASGELDDRHIAVEVAQPDEDLEPATPLEEAAEEATEEEEEPYEPSPDLGESFTWSAVLRESHRQEQRIWVHPDADLAPHQGHIVLRLTHHGEIDDSERVQKVSLSSNGGWLYGVRFPLDFFTGIRLTCMAQRGGAVVFASTETLPNEVSVAGTEYGFALDRHTIDPGAPRSREPRLFDRAVRAIDRYGEDMENRWRRLDAVSISELIFGPEAAAVGERAVATELRSEPNLVRLDADGMWWHQALVAGRRLFAGQGPTGGIFAGASDALRRAVLEAPSRHRREHRVPLHLRRLLVSERATPERAAAYAILREHAPNRARLPQTLPEGYTFVISHFRGGRHDRE